MRVDIAGRVNNTSLHHRNCLLPLYEAIVNSMDAIGALPSREKGRIEIEVLRDRTQVILDTKSADYESLPVSGFAIKDNGEGFTDVNFQAFDTCDTMIKHELGGKGIGRFLWLKAFEQVRVTSVYDQNGSRFQRSFDFSIDGDGVHNPCNGPVSDDELHTSVRLLDFKEPYRSNCPKTLADIADGIAEHCLEYFMLDTCPLILVGDECGDTISVNEQSVKSVVLEQDCVPFEVKQSAFKILNVRLHLRRHDYHRVHYCAHKRVVKSERLQGLLPDVDGRMKDDQDRRFVYAAYVSGGHLDATVNPSRTDFTIQQKSEQQTTDELYWEDIYHGVRSKAEAYLEPYMVPFREEKLEKIRLYIQRKAPYYRYLVEKYPDALRRIPANIQDDGLELELYQIHHAKNVEVKRQAQEILETDISTVKDLDEYKHQYNEFMQKLNDGGKAELSRYIVHRKLVLQLLENSLQIVTADKYQREENIHRIVFPRGKTSDDIGDYDTQNLWIIDERLCYHAFLASDKQIKGYPTVESDSSRRPDLAVFFDQPLAYAEGGDYPRPSIVIIEFKRPGREDFHDSADNPIGQVYRYIEDIRSGAKKDCQGRPFGADDATQFYCYIIADLEDSLKKQAHQYGFTRTADRMGYYHYNPNYNAYTEIISFDKLVQDANKRNRILFEKLNLPG